MMGIIVNSCRGYGSLYCQPITQRNYLYKNLTQSVILSGGRAVSQIKLQCNRGVNDSILNSVASYEVGINVFSKVAVLYWCGVI